MSAAAAPLLVIGAGVLLLSAGTKPRRRAAPRPAECTSWAVPKDAAVPRDVAVRAQAILRSGAPCGASFVETWDGTLYKFVVETHGPNDQNPARHKGVGVRVCARMGRADKETRP
jgi:hypothetical protein